MTTEAEFYSSASLLGVFDSMEEFMGAALNPPVGNRMRDNWRCWNEGHSGSNSSWFGLQDEPTFGRGNVRTPDVCKLVSSGWIKGADRILKAFEQIVCNTTPKIVRRQRIRADQGDALDIHAVYSGNLDRAWDKCAPRDARGARRVTIVNDALASGGEDSERMFWRGAAVCALTDKLLHAGYAVQVISGWRGGLDCGGAICRVQVKGFSAPLDALTLAAGVALPAFFRSIGHAWGCGWAEHHSGTGFSVYGLAAMPGEILMSNSSGIYDAATASKWITEQINLLEAQ